MKGITKRAGRGGRGAAGVVGRAVVWRHLLLAFGVDGRGATPAEGSGGRMTGVCHGVVIELLHCLSHAHYPAFFHLNHDPDDICDQKEVE